MSFTFPCDVQILIRERISQFEHLGVSADAIQSVSPHLNDLWTDGPGGWTFEWSKEAASAEARGETLQAAMLYGVARFPCFGNRAHMRAHDRQLVTYLRAMTKLSDTFSFDRQVIHVPYRETVTLVAVHLLKLKDLPADSPLVLYTGGVDTWKMDVHYSAMRFARQVGAHIALLDMPGTGESEVPLAADADVILGRAIETLRVPGQKVGYIAFSFTGLWAAKLALQGAIDAAILIGAPIDDSFSYGSVTALFNGMGGIIGNAMGFADLPEPHILASALAPFSLRHQGLLDKWSSTTPLFVVNGDRDPYIPASDVTVFRGRPETEVKLVANATHCAPEQMHTLMPELANWLSQRLTTS